VLIGSVSLSIPCLQHAAIPAETLYKVKPNVGHSEGASGITSLIKAVLMLKKRTIPPNIKLLEPNPKSKCCVATPFQR
jgi:3-oxoacyl-(acyl-carrier-protein) synthase